MNFSKSPETIQKMFNTIAKRYDFNNNLISLGMHKKIKELSLKNLTVKENSNVMGKVYPFWLGYRYRNIDKQGFRNDLISYSITRDEYLNKMINN